MASALNGGALNGGARPPLLIAAHGTRDGAGVAAFSGFAGRVAKLAAPHRIDVAGGFIELSGPPLREAVAELVGLGHSRVVAVPLMLAAAGHSKGDVPASLARESDRHQGLTWEYGRALGPHPVLLDLLDRRVRAAAGDGEPPAVLLVGRGSTDPDANAEVVKTARLLWEGRDFPLAETAFVSLARPSVPEGLDRCLALGARRVVVARYFLFPGVLPGRVADQAAGWASAHPGVDVRVTDVIGDCDELASLVWDRYTETISGNFRINCDMCVYRVALPGFEHRVGAPQHPHDHPHDRVREGGGAMGGTTDLRFHGDQEVAPGLTDLAVNVRADAPPPWLVERIAASLADLAAYPDPRAATETVARFHGRPASEVMITAGAAEAFTLIARARPWRRAVVVHPQFTEPEAALLAAGHRVDRVTLDGDFLLDPAAVPEDADLVVVGNPTNPTSVLHPADALAALARPGRVLVVDEAFADCVPGEPESLAPRRELPGLIVVRSLTKTWGLAGLRVGYVLAGEQLLAAMADGRPPWAVSAPALAAARACCRPAARAEAEVWARAMISERRSLISELSSIPGVHVVPGAAASFLLLRVQGGERIRAALRESGFAVRRGDTFPGLTPDWIRIAIRDGSTNARFARALATAISATPVRADAISATPVRADATPAPIEGAGGPSVPVAMAPMGHRHQEFGLQGRAQ